MVQFPDFWTLVGLALALVALVPTMISIPKAGKVESWIARICWLGSFALCEGELVSWAMKRPNMSRLTIAGLAGAALTIGLVIGFSYIHEKIVVGQPGLQPVGSINSLGMVPREILSAQLREFDEIQKFIVQKDENTLRTEFDFENIVSWNLALARKTLLGGAVPQAELDAITNAFKGGKGLTNTRYAKLTTINNVLHVEPIAQFSSMNTTANYIIALNHLIEIANSPNLPSSVTEALRDFRLTLQSNVPFFVDVLNREYTKDPRTIIEFNDYNSPYYGVVIGAYYKGFQPLEPKAQAVGLAIRKYLDVK